MGRGSEREIGQSACTPPLLNPLTVLAGQESGAGKGTHTLIHTNTHTHMHTHTCRSRWGTCVFDKIEPVGVQRAWLRCVMSSTQPWERYVIVLLIRVRTRRFLCVKAKVRHEDGDDHLDSLFLFFHSRGVSSTGTVTVIFVFRWWGIQKERQKTAVEMMLHWSLMTWMGQ